MCGLLIEENCNSMNYFELVSSSVKFETMDKNLVY